MRVIDGYLQSLQSLIRSFYLVDLWFYGDTENSDSTSVSRCLPPQSLS